MLKYILIKLIAVELLFCMQVLTLSGVGRVFNTKRQLLQMLGDFPRAWSLLLEFIENSALSKNNEVCIYVQYL